MPLLRYRSLRRARSTQRLRSRERDAPVLCALRAGHTSGRGREALGGLMPPVAGRVSRNWGDDLPGGETAKGLYIQPRASSDIVAPIDGTIEYADEFRSYGKLLIISTSDGYHIVLSGMGRIYGTPGQTVRAGEPVGRMSERANPPPELYLEVRRNGVPMNPARWMQGG